MTSEGQKSKVKGQGQTLETLKSNISKMVYEIESIQIGRVVVFNIYQKQTLKLNEKNLSV